MPDTDGKLDLRSETYVHAQARYEIDIVNLVLNNIAIIGHTTPLLVNLSANDVPLIIHLVAGIGRVVLVIPEVDT